MKASELRIGNYHYYIMNDLNDDRKEWLELCTIDVTDLQLLTDYPNDTNFVPAELNEKWLIDFGFELEIYNDKSHAPWYNKNLKNENEISVNLKNKTFTIGSYHEWVFPMELKYVHELQNLHFALTGIELTKKI